MSFLKQVEVVLKDFRKQITSNWEKSQLIMLSVLLIAQLVFYSFLPSDLTTLVMSLLGIITVILISAGKSLNYLLGFISSAYLFYLAASNGVFGDMLVQVGFIYFDIVGFIAWQQNRNGIVEKAVDFSRRQKNKVFFGGLLLLLIAPFILGLLGDPHPFIDGLTFTIGMLAMYATKVQYRHQFVFWMASNVAQIILWGFVGQHTPAGLTVLTMYLLYLINSIVAHKSWLDKDIKELV